MRVCSVYANTIRDGATLRLREQLCLHLDQARVMRLVVRSAQAQEKSTNVCICDHVRTRGSAFARAYGAEKKIAHVMRLHTREQTIFEII